MALLWPATPRTGEVGKGVRMEKREGLLRELLGGALGVALVLSLVVSPCALAGCGRTPAQTEPTDSGQPADDPTGGDAAAGDAADPATSAQGLEEVIDELAGEDGDSLDSLANECTDRHGNVTAFAVSELTGAQLDVFMPQQGYEWSERERMWIKDDGSSALVAYDAKGEAIAADALAQLGVGSAEAGVRYRLVTSGYPNAQRALEALVSSVMMCEDVEYSLDGSAGVAVAHGPLMHRSLVLVSATDGVYAFDLFSQGAIEAGLLDDVSGKELGTTIEAAFEALAGRELGSEA